MKKEVCFLILLSFCVVLVLGLFGCGGGGSSSPTFPMVLVDTSGPVGSQGGAFEVRFSANNGWQIRITLRDSSVSPNASTIPMEPYGYITNPDGTGDYYLPNGAAQNGQNSAELTLTQTGTYTLTVFDGTNQGGTVSVKIERLS